MTAAALDFTPARNTRARPDAVAAWLFAVAALVFALVVVGGLTRLTGSGLSIVRWAPVGGIVPPLTAADWTAAFAAYQASPQYAQVNAGMSLAAFKGIFFWEYLHRLLARGIGVAFALPLAWFAWRRAIPAGYGPRLVAILGLGGLQGAIGWWMVASGLVDRPAVAHERLAVHLVMALTIMGACLWTALDLRSLDCARDERNTDSTARLSRPQSRDARALNASDSAHPERSRGTRPTRWIVPFVALLGVQIVWGAFVAGLHAGHASDTWPLMFGYLVPPGLGSIVGDPVTVHFVHRSLGYAVAVAAVTIAVTVYRAGARGRALAVAGLVALQFGLGIATVLTGVPLVFAALHQAGAALLLAATLWTAHWCRA